MIWFQVTNNNLRKQLYLQVTILNTNNLQLYGIKYSYKIKIIFLIHLPDQQMRTKEVLQLWVKVDLEVMAMKEYTPELETRM